MQKKIYIKDGTYLKSLVFNFPIPTANGGTGREISLEYSDMLETIVILTEAVEKPEEEAQTP